LRWVLKIACIPANAAIDAHDAAAGAVGLASVSDANVAAPAAVSCGPRCDILQRTVSFTITAFIWSDCQTVKCTAQAALSCDAALLLLLYISQLEPASCNAHADSTCYDMPNAVTRGGITCCQYADSLVSCLCS